MTQTPLFDSLILEDMCTIFQYLGNIFKLAGSHIVRKPKLLIAAVLLFVFLWIFPSPLDSQAGWLFGGEKEVGHENLSSQMDLRPVGANITFLAADAFANSSKNLAVLTENTDEDSADNFIYIDQEDYSSVVQKDALLANSGPITFETQEPRDEVIEYVVQEGDIPSLIAASHGISAQTLLWANDLDDGELIQPGDVLEILPTSGVLHKVKSGDTIGEIADKYDAKEDDIIAFNSLPADGSIKPNQNLVVPDGVMPRPSYSSSYNSYSGAIYTNTNSQVTGAGTGRSLNYLYGQCTWYVAQKRYVPWSGHAKHWLANAQAMGFSVCWGSSCQPQAGAIISLRGSSWLSQLYGHVAYVESVANGWITFSEMNYAGRAVKSVRRVPVGSSAIVGFIY